MYLLCVFVQFCGAHGSCMPHAVSMHRIQGDRDRSDLAALCRRRRLRLSKKSQVIPSQCAHWRGNPPNRRKNYLNCSKKLGDCHIVPEGAQAAWFAMTGFSTRSAAEDGSYPPLLRGGKPYRSFHIVNPAENQARWGIGHPGAGGGTYRSSAPCRGCGQGPFPDPGRRSGREAQPPPLNIPEDTRGPPG